MLLEDVLESTPLLNLTTVTVPMMTILNALIFADKHGLRVQVRYG